MLRVIIADPDMTALEELNMLLDWKKEGFDVIGTVTDGNELIDKIGSLHPDLVILDTDITAEAGRLTAEDGNAASVTGLDIVRHYRPFRQYVRFIVTSRYEDFSLLKQTLKSDALDYLLKPIRKKELRETLKEAISFAESRMEMESVLQVNTDFREEQYPAGILKIPDTDGHYCEQILDSSHIDFENEFAVGICIGIVPEIAEELAKINYQKYTILTLSVYSRILTWFREKDIGFEVRRTAHRIRMMGVFPLQEEKNYCEKYILPLLKELEERYDTRLCTGIGSHAYTKDRMYPSYQDAQFCNELYFFEQKPVFVWADYQKDAVDAQLSQEAYEKHQDKVFHAILTRDPEVFHIIEESVDLIAETHYGNWQAVIMRSMDYTGEICSRLRRYRLIEGDFFDMQNELQNKLFRSVLYQDVKRELMEYFHKLLPRVYKNTRHSGKMAVEEVKHYMQENFMRELSAKELSEVACVSPNYFSHMFKNETGQNYKAYLTAIRLDHAVNLLLNADYGLNEISERCGYQNVRTFVDAFKQKYVLSPTKYKKKMLEKDGEQK